MHIPEDVYLDRVFAIAENHGWKIEINSKGWRQVVFPHKKKLHEGHLNKMHPEILSVGLKPGLSQLIDKVAPGRPCAHVPMRNIIKELRENPTPSNGGIVMPDIDTVWAGIKASEGQVFKTKRGCPFTYKVKGDHLVVTRIHPKRHDITIPPLYKNEFKTALDLGPVKGPGEINKGDNKGVGGPAYIWGILNNEYIQPDDWSAVEYAR